jgi:hypothetical protein
MGNRWPFMLYYCMRTAAFRGSVCSLIGGSRPRAGVLGGLIGISFILLVTTISSSAGPENGQIRVSRPALSAMGNQGGMTRARVMGHALNYPGYRMDAVNVRGPLVVAPRWRSNQENVTENPTQGVTEPRSQDATPQPKDPNPMVAPQSLSPRSQGTTPGSISPPHNPIHLPANPINPLPGLNPRGPSAAERSETTANINHKFEQAENKERNDPSRSPDRRDRLERSRVFFIGLIDDGYPLQVLDTWCDDLLNDQVDTGMPVDLVDSYWGEPVSSQDYVEYYNPYQVCTYQTPDGNYRQVTFQNGVVAPGS